ncbi:M10 family metallopeptidase C-terminal domain-containing protein, partial [Roseiarcus fermentans]|uniref:M10 family metallopeptidase C-terminal domain-containing protein n=1 Tax=Roseiarcus fermentans TaxID=1473586 RepID=UPI001AECDD6C
SDPGVLLPGIDTVTGNQTPLASLSGFASLPGYGAAITYDKVNNIVRISGNGLTVSGYNFGTATVYVQGSNITITNCTFTGTTGWYAVQVLSGSNTTVSNCTFVGDPTSKNEAVIYSTGSVAILNNTFINTPNDGIDAQGGGVISGNYFSGAGNNGGGHADAIWITNSSNPMTISDNFISWSLNPASTVNDVNNCIRITGELGPVSNVTVTGNYLLGGSSTLQAIQVGGQGALSNVSVTNNYLGFGTYYSFYPGSAAGITESGNVVFDWTNPAWSTSAWAAYSAAGPSTAYALTGNVSQSAAGSLTLYGAGQANLVMYGGSAYETNFVGGFGSQTIWSGAGANVYTYLAVSDSPVSLPDTIANFDPAKDVIDLSHIDGDLATPGVQSFAFIGSAAFDGAGPEVRAQQNANGTTSVQVALAGDTTADMQIAITGVVNLTSANFALTAAQSATDMANGAAITTSLAPLTSWPLAIDNETNVQGRAYSSFAAIWSGSYVVADDLNLSASAGEIDILGPSGVAYTAMTIAKGGGAETVTSDGKTASLTFHQTETIQAGSAQAPETFAFTAGFGNETINGFALSGHNADLLQLRAADYAYLTPAMTQAQDVAAVL